MSIRVDQNREDEDGRISQAQSDVQPKDTKSITLTHRERVILWSIVAWFQTNPRLVTGSLMQKLFPDGGNEMYRYDKQIEDRIISVANFLERKRQEEVSDLVEGDSDAK